MNALIKTLSLSLEVREIKMEHYSALWNQPALGLHALLTQLKESWLLQCELTAEQCDKQWTLLTF